MISSPRDVHLGALAEPSPQTRERLAKAVRTLSAVEQLACALHDHVSFAKAWVLLSKGVAQALDYDSRLVSPPVVAPLQRNLEDGLRRSFAHSLVDWGPGLLSRALRHRLRTGLFSICTCLLCQSLVRGSRERSAG